MFAMHAPCDSPRFPGANLFLPWFYSAASRVRSVFSLLRSDPS
jgi:hypothetical protein